MTLNTTVSNLLHRAALMAAPPPDLTVSQWADEFRRLSSEASAEPGRWKTSRAPYQREILDAVNDPACEMVVVMSSAQVGKALAIDTAIPTPEGFIAMGDLKVGDKVFDEKGDQCSVTAATEVMYNRSCYNVTFSDGSSVIADADHRWLVDIDKHGVKSRENVVTTSGMINSGVKSGNRNRFSVPMHSPIEGAQRDFDIDPYTLGLWLGDGNSKSAQLTAHIDDSETYLDHLKSFGYSPQISAQKNNTVTIKIDPYKPVRDREFCKRGHRVTSDNINKKGQCKKCAVLFSQRVQGRDADLTITHDDNQSFFSKLNSLGLIGNKRIPVEYLRASIEQRYELLRGLMDTDGSISKNGRSEFTTTSEGIKTGVSELLYSLGIKHTIKERQPFCLYKGKRVQGKKAYRFSFLAYDDTPIFKLERKLCRMVSKVGRRTSETFTRWIVSIEKVESVPVRCIQVDSPKSLYLCGQGFITTHNTELLLNTIGYFVDYDPAPILLLQPTLEMAQAFSKDRMAPMVRDTPPLRGKIADSKARDSGNTILHKSFPGGHITMAGANSPASLASRPIRILLADEVDRFPPSAGTEGDPFNLAKKRTTTFWNKKVLAVSTPTVKGASRIEALYADSTQEQYQLPCPECGHYQPLVWAQISFDECGHACNNCGVISGQYQWLSGTGLWIAQAEHTTTRGFHLNELVSPWRRWEQIIADFREAKKTPDTLKVWVNTSLGETWEEEGDSVEHHILYQRREHYQYEVPAGAVVLTCAVDVQDDRLECEVNGWGDGEENWRIDLRIIRGDPARPEIWKELAEFLDTRYVHASGVRLGISCTAIDSGGHFTQQVYQFVKSREGRRVYAIKGKAGAGVPVVGRPSRSNLGRVQLFMVGVDTAKEIVLARLKVCDPGAGYAHFPVKDCFDEEYFRQLTAEQCITSFVNGRPVRKWKKTRARNEAFDLAVYNTAALYILNPNFQALATRLEPEDPEEIPEPTITQQINQERRAARRPRRRSGGFANSWR